MTIDRMNRRMLMQAVGATALAIAVQPAWSQSFPTKPVRIVHGYNPGTNPDVISRIIAPKFGELLGQSIVIETKPGAAGRIGTGYVATQPPDGYTMMMLTHGDTVTAAFDEKQPYELLKDFTFIASVIHVPLMIVVSADSPIKTTRDLIEAAKKEGGLTYGTPGVATTQHLIGEQLKHGFGLDLVHVPYRENAFPDLIAGRIDLMIAAPSVSIPQIESGRVRAIAVTSRGRIDAAPDVPAVSEELTDFEVTSWLGLAVPAGTPAPVVERLRTAMREVLEHEPTRKQLLGTGSEVGGLIGEDFRARVEADVSRWKALTGKVTLG